MTISGGSKWEGGRGGGSKGAIASHPNKIRGDKHVLERFCEGDTLDTFFKTSCLSLQNLKGHNMQDSGHMGQDLSK